MTTVTFVKDPSATDPTEHWGVAGFLAFDRYVDGTAFNFSSGSSMYPGRSLDIRTDNGPGRSNLTGVYALTQRGDSHVGVDFTVQAAPGYTFDLTGFKTVGSVSSITVYYNGMTTSQAYGLTPGVAATLANLADFDDVTSVTFTANAFALFQDLEITDIKPIAAAAPSTVTDAHIAISGATGTGGAYRIGDTVRATWNNTASGDNNGGVSGVTMDFSQFGGGAAVTATNSGGTWTATYTITAGAIDATDRNVAVSATNAGGTTTTADSSNARVDNIAPAAPPAPSLDRASDTGNSDTDGVTSDTTPTFSGTAESGSTVTLYTGATAIGTATASNGTWSITASALSAGSHAVTATATDAAGNVSGASAATVITIDTTPPEVMSVGVPANGTYGAGRTLSFTVYASEAITVDTTGGMPHIEVVIGHQVRSATYDSGSGTTALTFNYTVQPDDIDADGITVGPLLASGGTVRDAAGNDLGAILNSVGSTAAVLVDGSIAPPAPAASGVDAASASGIYKAGATITLSVAFDAAVDVDTSGGTPTLALGNGGSAVYVGGSGSSVLTFAYTVAAGQDSADLDYASSTALALNGATIKAADGTHPDATLVLPAPGTAGSLGANEAIVIDTTAPAVTLSNLALSADTGASPSDFVTNVATQAVGATLSAPLASGERLYGSVDGGHVWTDVTAFVSGTTLTWSGVTLAAGAGSLRLKAGDAAGNDGAVLAQAYTLDTAAPAFQSASVDGARLVLRYADADRLDVLHGPTSGAYAVTAGGSAVAVSGLAIDAAAGTVTLTLAHAVGAGQAVTVAYADPGAGDDAQALQDRAGNDAASLAPVAATNLTAAPPPPPSTPPATVVSQTVDGVVVRIETETGADGRPQQTLTVPIVEATRQDQVGHNDVADIPLVKAADGAILLSAQVPAGMGLLARGAPVPDTDHAVSGLLAAIVAHTASGSSDMADGAIGFVRDLGATPLLVQAIVPALVAGAVPAGPMVLQGQPHAAGTPQTALVIDGGTLPAGFALHLQDVDFAAVTGALTVMAGSGVEAVYGDGAGQTILLGAGDHVLHGGGGDDILGSAGGHDVIDGGTGTDTLRLAGALRDYTLRIMDGKTVFTPLDGAGSATVANVELLQFGGEADHTLDFNASEAATLVRMYSTLFERRPDEGGINFWLDALAHGVSLRTIADDFVTSAEAAALHGDMDNDAWVGSLYRTGLGRDGSAGERADWVARLESGAQDRGQVLLGFAESVEKIGLVGVVTTSIETV